MFLSCVASSQESKTAVLEYSLETGQSACPGENITFTCIVRGSRILSWSSDEYIGTDDVVDFTTNDTKGEKRYINKTDTYATLIDVKSGDQELSLESELHIRSNQSSPVSCMTGNNENRQSIHFTVLGDGMDKCRLRCNDTFFLVLSSVLYTSKEF